MQLSLFLPSQKRFEELSILQRSSIHNQVYPIQKPDYATEVTDASSKFFVLVNLTSSSGGNVESHLLTEIWRDLAAKYGDIKFCEIRGDMCIEGYPDKNTPTILAYKDGEIKRQIVTLKELNGTRTNIQGQFLDPITSGRKNRAAAPHVKAYLQSFFPLFAKDFVADIDQFTDLENMLVSLGAIKKNDSRLSRRSDMYDRDNEANANDDDDDDWD